MTIPDFLASPGLCPVLQALPRARLVGGCVRDMLAGKPVSDIDLATPDTPDQITRNLTDAGLRAIPTGIAHGTITALSHGQTFEITTLRRDIETDGRHATVAFTDDWQQDAARRDFTINALSMTPNGEVFDYFDGRTDLKNGRVRFVGDPGQRIAEDRLRILRYFRFLARFGQSPPDSAATTAIAAATQGLAQLSAERVWSELKRILAAPKPDAALALMKTLGVLARILPENQPRNVDTLPAEPLLRLAVLLCAPTDAVARRLKLSGEEAETLQALHGPSPPSDDPALRRLLADTPPDILAGRAALAGQSADAIAHIRAMPVPVFPLQGRDLLALGLAPGPEIGAALKRLRRIWLEGGGTAGRDQLLAQLAAPDAS